MGYTPKIEDLEYKTPSPDGKIYVAFHQDGWDEVITIRDAKTDNEIHRIINHGDTPTSFKFTPDGKQLASYCPRNGFALWDVATGKLLLRMRPKKKP